MADPVVTLRLVATDDGYQAQVVRAEDQVERFGREGERAGRRARGGMTEARKGVDATNQSLTRMRNQALAAVGAFVGFREIGRLVNGTVSEFTELDSAMTESIAIMSGVDDMMRNRMTGAARQMAEDLNFGAEKGGEAFFFLASAGLDAERSIAALPQVGRFARAGMFDLATATDLATDSQSALGLTVDDTQQNLANLTRVTDVLVKANTLANASVEQFATALTNKAGASLRNVNKDIEEGVAVLAAYADQGVKSQRAGEQLTIILRELQRAARDQADEWAEMGLSVFDANGEIRNMADIVGDLEGALGTMSPQMRGATLETLGFQQESIQALEALLGTSEAIREYEKELRNAGGTTEQVASNQMQSLENRAGQVQEQFNNLRGEIAERFAPDMLEAIDSVSAFMDSIDDEDIDAFVGALRSVDDIVKVLIVAIGARMVAALGKQAGAVVAAQVQWVRYQATLASMAGVSARVASAQIAMGVAARGAGAAMGLVGGPIGALAVGAWGLYEAVGAMNDRFDEVGSLAPDTADAVAQAMEKIRTGAQDAAQATSEALDRLQQDLANARAELDRLNEAFPEGGIMGFLSDPYGLAERGKQELRGRIDEVTEATRELNAATAVSEGEDIFSRIAGGVMPALEAFNDFAGASEEASKKAKEDAQAVDEAWKKATDAGRDQVEQLREQIDTFDLSQAAVLRYKAEQVALNETYGDESERVAALMESLADLHDEKTAAEEATRAQEEAEQALNDRLAEQKALIDRLNPEQAKLARFGEQAAMLFQARMGGSDGAFGITDMLGGIGDNAENALTLMEDLFALMEDADIGGLGKLSDELEDLRASFNASYDEARRFQEGMELIRKADAAGLFDTEEEMQQMIEDLKRITIGTNAWAAEMERGAGLVEQGFREMQGMFEEGTKGFQAMAVAADAANLVRAVGAVINQGMGDPYTAFARMAMMAAAVSKLGYSVGAMSSSMGLAEQRQETQGTGSVLGDETAKSESISNAMEITADATSELVGINRRMSRSLEDLNAALTGATTQLARGFGNIEFPEMDSGIGWLGGDANVVDQGVEITGGTIGELIDEVLVQAFRDVEERGWLLDDYDLSTQTEDLGDQAGRQFQLIFQSIAETVQEGAEALGLAGDDVAQAIAQFEVEAQKISLKDLSAEEQREELEAVFSRIFDDLAGDVVPFIDQFQRVGEGLGETLVRVATSVQVMEEAIDRLGFSAQRTGPEQFAQISVGLIEMAGGINEFIEQMEGFIDAFASEEHKLATARADMVSAFAQMGQQLPESRDAVWDLMEAQDANTEEGRRAIATLLELTDSMDEFFSGLEKWNDDVADLREEAARASGAFNPLDHAIGEITDRMDDLLARGRALGASEAELADIRTASNILIQDAIDDWREQQAEFTDGITDELARLSGAGSDFQRQLADIAVSMQEEMEEARRLGLDTANVQALALARQAEAVRELESSIRDFVAELYGTPLDQLDEQIAAIREQFAGAGEMGHIIERERLKPLLAERERLQEQQQAAERIDMARGLAQGVADLAGVRGVDDFGALADEFGFTLADLAGDLGIDQSRLTEYLKDLQAASYTLEDLTGGIDDLLGPHVDRIVEAILEEHAALEPGTKPVGDGGGGRKSSDGDVVEVDTSTATVALEHPVRAHDREMLTTLKQAATELNNILRAARDSKKVDEEGYSAIRSRLGDIQRTLSRDDPAGRRGRGRGGK